MKDLIERLELEGTELPSNLREATEVELSDLPPQKQKVAKEVAKILKADIMQIWDGIHGVIISLKSRQEIGGMRVGVGALSSLSRKVRWIQGTRDGMDVGF